MAPLTEGTLFHRGPSNQKNGAIAHLLCCTRAGCRGRKPIDQKYNDLLDEGACCNDIQAVRLLRAKITKQHGSDICLENARAAKGCDEDLGCDEVLDTVRPKDAFSALMLRCS